MAEKTITIKFDGYWRYKNKDGLPEKSGIYCVYTCSHEKSVGKISIKKLIYIGEAEDVKSRVANHEKYDDWVKYLNKGEELCFSFGDVESTDRQRAEAAMIFEHKPPENSEYVDSFPFDKTTISLSGETRLLSINFTVVRTK